MARKNNLRVVDFFCGAGGFSEGFRQQGFQIVRGVDYWQPAIDSHNINHGLNDTIKNVLDYWGADSSDVEEINQLENTEFIIGSPSCVSFSMSNQAGKASKKAGVRLIESYLRVIAVKRNQRGSVLKAWYMENVPKSRNFVRNQYTFKHLNLSHWAELNGFHKDDIALNVRGEILNAGDYGAPQDRRRFIAGEWIETGEFVSPRKTHKFHKTVAEIRSEMPPSNTPTTNTTWVDPNYRSLKASTAQITDHFYDTGVYKIEWEKAEFLKTNHPFMGKMPFPENEQRTSRTIIATRSARTRESLLYKSEYCRDGDGEYRLPTIREAASLMGFPYVYQFVGSENVKWRQIGNSVCPHQGAAIAKSLRKRMNLAVIPHSAISFSGLRSNIGKVDNLNTFTKKSFESPNKRLVSAKFRRHALKLGNMTVDLMNYHPSRPHITGKYWYVVAFLGTGQGYKVKVFSKKEKGVLEEALVSSLKRFDKYKNEIDSIIANKQSMQRAYEDDLHLTSRKNPISLLKELAEIITSHDCHRNLVTTKCITKNRKVPLAQIMSAYGLLTILNRGDNN